MSGVSISPPFALRSFSSSLQSTNRSSVNPTFPSLSSSITLKKQLPLRFGTATTGNSRRFNFRCNSTTGPGGSGDDESKNVLDAFFLGKALAEALNERIGSTVGEFLSVIGRLQSEQQRQIQDFQEDVLERAKKAKENAAREAMEAQGLVPKATKVDASTATYGVDSATSSSTTDVVTSANSPSSPNTYAVSTGPDPVSGALDED